MGVKPYWQLNLYDKEDKEIDYNDGDGPDIFDAVPEAISYFLKFIAVRSLPPIWKIEIKWKDGR